MIIGVYFGIGVCFVSGANIASAVAWVKTIIAVAVAVDRARTAISAPSLLPVELLKIISAIEIIATDNNMTPNPFSFFLSKYHKPNAHPIGGSRIDTTHNRTFLVK